MSPISSGRKRFALPLLCLFSILLAACGAANGAPPNVDNGQAGSFSASPAASKVPQSTTVQMPPTATGCPLPALSGRAAIMRPMTLGNDASVVYIDDQGTAPGGNSFAELKLYNTVTGTAGGNSKNITGTSTIVHLPGAIISEAQVSNDGQWVLFVTEEPGSSEIQMVRIDGQGLQTLYCAPPGTVHSVQWSPESSRFIFSQQAVSGLWNLYLFTLASGIVQPELVQLNSAGLGYEARTWLDDSRVYVVGVPNALTPAPSRGLFVLDTGKGVKQRPSDLLTIAPSSRAHFCWSFDSNYSSSVLITSQCTTTPGSGDLNGQQGPSSITAQGVTGDSARTVYTSEQDAVTQVRMLGYSSDTLLMCIANLNPANPSSAASDNGLWRMKLDGSERERLAQTDNFSQCEFNQFSQYPWANLSPDNRLFAIEASQVLGKSVTITLSYGPLDGGGPVVSFADASGNLGTLAIAGWTRM